MRIVNSLKKYQKLIIVLNQKQKQLLVMMKCMLKVYSKSKAYRSSNFR